MRRALAVVGLLAGISATAAADPLDTFGFGARASGLAGAVTADSTGAAAAHANPAAVLLAEHPELTIGWGYGRMALDLDGKDADVLDAHGTDLGLAVPLHTKDLDAAFGLALYLPDQFVARVQLIPASEPHFIRLDNDVHRLVLEPVVAVRLAPWLSVGGGATVLADVAGNGITFNVGVVGGQKVGESMLDVSVPPRVAPLAGALITPTKRVRLAATYRGAIDLGLRLAILANVDVAGVITGDVLIDVRAVNYYTPARAVGAASVDVTRDLTLSAELGWEHWSAFSSGVPDVNVLIGLGISPPLVNTLFPKSRFRDVAVPRFGAEWRLHPGRVDVALRGGYAYEPSPVPAQVGLTSFADNDRHVFAVGAGLTLRAFPSILTRPVSVDVGLQWHHLRDRLTLKDQSAFPGRAFSSGGDIVRLGATMTVEF